METATNQPGDAVKYWCMGDEEDSIGLESPIAKGYEQLASKLECTNDQLDVCVVKSPSPQDWDSSQESSLVGIKLACCHCGECNLIP